MGDTAGRRRAKELLSDGHIASNQASADLTRHLGVKNNLDTNQIANWHAQVAANHDNMNVLHGVVSFASKKIGDLNRQINQKMEDPTLPAGVKDAYMANHNVQINQLAVLMHTATGAIDSLKNRQQTQLDRQQARADKAQGKSDKAAEDEAQRQAETYSNALVERMQALTEEDPIKNSIEIQKAAQQLSQYATNSEASHTVTGRCDWTRSRIPFYAGR